MWDWPGPDTGFIVSYTASESLRDSPSAQEFNVNLYYVGGKTFSQIEPFATTVTIPIDTEGSFISGFTEPPAARQRSIPVPNHGGGTVCLSSRKGLHFDVAAVDYPSLHILIIPLNNLGSDGGKALRMSVSSKEFEKQTLTIKVDMDEATGRVVIWGWDSTTSKAKIFIGDLV